MKKDFMKIDLYPELEPAPGGCPEDNFMPYLETSFLDGGRTPLGAVLVMPGGGYSHRAPHEGNPVARRFNMLGYHAFVLQYRVKPYRYPCQLRDGVRAIQIIREHAAEWDIRGDQIAVLGFSSGAHLAGSCLLAGDRVAAPGVDWRPNAAILCYPVISITEEFGHHGSAEVLFGTDEAARKQAESLNLEHLIKPDTPPVFLWHTADDDGVPAENSLAFARGMWRNNRSCELHIYPHGLHGRGLAREAPDLAHWSEAAATFLECTAGFARGKWPEC